MGIITKEVAVKVGRSSMYYYNLGYKVPMHKIKCKSQIKHTALKNGYVFSNGEEFFVKIEDLPKQSDYKIEIQCDKCEKKYTVTFCSINNSKCYIQDKKTYCWECANKIYNSGENNYQWKSNLTKEDREIRRATPEYNVFKRNVLMRDEFKCICCHKDYKLIVHHLNGYDNFPDERFDVSNGVTLCNNCHKNFHLLYGRGNNTKKQFEEWYGSVKDIVSKEYCNLYETKRVYCFETDTVYQGVIFAIESLKLKRMDKKEILECCNKSANTLSVRGLHFFWEEDIKGLSQNDIQEIVLNRFDNPRKSKFIDLNTGIVYPNGKVCKEINVPDTKSRFTDIRYTKTNILKKQLRFVPYKVYLNFDDELKQLVKFSEIKYYKELA